MKFDWCTIVLGTTLLALQQCMAVADQITTGPVRTVVIGG